MIKRLSALIIAIEPRVYEVFWVLLAAAGVNIITGALETDSSTANRLVTGGLLVLIGIFVFLAGQSAGEVRARAVRIQTSERRGRLQSHIRTAIEEPGYSSLARASTRWIGMAVLACAILVVGAVWRSR